MVKVVAWDTAGMERSRTISSVCYRKVKAALLVCEIGDFETLDIMDFWLAEVNKFARPDIVKVLIGNKVDEEVPIELDPQNRWKEAAEYAAANDLEYFKVSAKTGQNVKDMLQCTFRKILGTETEKNKEILKLSDVPDANVAVRESSSCFGILSLFPGQ